MALPIDQAETLSMCSVHAGGRTFGIATRHMREVLGERRLERVPLAPAWIVGLVPYRGDVLTAVCLRVLLGIAPSPAPGCILVLDDQEEGEHFALVVDHVDGVLTVERKLHAPIPATLGGAGRGFFLGSFLVPSGLLVQIDPERLRPARLAATELFKRGCPQPSGPWEDRECGR